MDLSRAIFRPGLRSYLERPRMTFSDQTISDQTISDLMKLFLTMDKPMKQHHQMSNGNLKPMIRGEVVSMGEMGMSEYVEKPSQQAGHWTGFVLGILGLLVVGSSPLMAEPQLLFEPLPDATGEASPPLPDLGEFPVQLVLDDDGAEGTFGVGAPEAFQFMWFNQFDRGGFPAITLEEVWVLFPNETNVTVGESIEIAVYLDDDGDPSNGAELLTSFDETIQVADGDTFSIYPLPTPLIISGPGDILIGVVNRFVVSGVTSETRPAAIDVTASQARSWVGVWSTDPPDDLVLPADLIFEPIDGTIPGNWMIRGFGTEAPAIVVPTLDRLGLLALALLLTAGGLAVMRRQRVQPIKSSR